MSFPTYQIITQIYDECNQLAISTLLIVEHMQSPVHSKMVVKPGPVFQLGHFCYKLVKKKKKVIQM